VNGNVEKITSEVRPIIHLSFPSVHLAEHGRTYPTQQASAEVPRHDVSSPPLSMITSTQHVKFLKVTSYLLPGEVLLSRLSSSKSVTLVTESSSQRRIGPGSISRFKSAAMPQSYQSTGFH
jgi:hypothetical protein